MERIQRPTMTVQEMAKELGVSRVAAYDITERADFPALVKLGRKKIILTERFYEWLDNLSGKNLR